MNSNASRESYDSEAVNRTLSLRQQRAYQMTLKQKIKRSSNKYRINFYDMKRLDYRCALHDGDGMIIERFISQQYQPAAFDIFQSYYINITLPSNAP